MRGILSRRLLKICGTTCFVDVKTYKCKIHPDFRAVCTASWWLDCINKEWHQSLKEAAAYHTGYPLISLFALNLRKCVQ